MVEMLGIFLFYTISLVSVVWCIYGGNVANRGQFPYQVSIRKYYVPITRDATKVIRSDPHCGGALISDRWVLTAAHCISGKYSDFSNLIIVAGAHHYLKDGVWYGIEQTVAHPSYSKFQNDIGLIKTNKTVEFAPNIVPIPLSGRKIGDGEYAVISGWGQDESGQKSTDLKYLTVKVMNNQLCKDNQADDFYASQVYDTTICTQRLPKIGPYEGDSGGPLALHGKLIGVISWGPTYDQDQPDQHTRISPYLAWIHEYTKIIPSY